MKAMKDSHTRDAMGSLRGRIPGGKRYFIV
jgi:hypothetical protein